MPICANDASRTHDVRDDATRSQSRSILKLIYIFVNISARASTKSSKYRKYWWLSCWHIQLPVSIPVNKFVAISKWRPFWKFWNIQQSFNLTSDMNRSSQIMPKVSFMVMTSSMTSQTGLNRPFCPACRTYLIATRFWVVVICPIIKCLTVLKFSFVLFDLCLFITIFNFILNCVPIVTFWIFTYHKIWILLVIFCFIWNYWFI